MTRSDLNSGVVGSDQTKRSEQWAVIEPLPLTALWRAEGGKRPRIPDYETLAEALYQRRGLDLDEFFVDGCFAPPKWARGGWRTKQGKGMKLMAVAFLLAIYTESASPHEATVVQQTPAVRVVDELPSCSIGGKAYDVISWTGS